MTSSKNKTLYGLPGVIQSHCRSVPLGQSVPRAPLTSRGTARLPYKALHKLHIPTQATQTTHAYFV